MICEKIIKNDVYPPMHHCISAIKDKDDILAVWYSASYETSPDSVIRFTSKHNNQWMESKIIIGMLGFGLGNPVLWECPNGELWLFFVLLVGNDWKSSIVCRKKSKDKGKSWTELEVIFDQKGIMTKGRPLILKNGNYLLPVYDEKRWSSMVLLSSDGINWKLYGETTITGLIQPVVVELDGGSLMMMSRSKMGKIYVSYSFNDGLSWTVSIPTSIINPNSGIDVVKYNDMFVLAHNHQKIGRNKMDLLFSKDEGKTWSMPFCVKEEEKGEYSYPWLLLDKDRLHLFFTNNRVNFIHESFENSDMKELNYE